ncbi:hypothetical protein FH603_5639 [Spirosoma sp. LMG 31447]|uniref:Uncharacterized protein n=1 Tax=Spirosoma utsteinense TaxID=2585773 RepID=A0ABR6WEY8_9BACT|nr:hypothetical protein [Spirosoma utsteinense]
MKGKYNARPLVGGDRALCYFEMCFIMNVMLFDYKQKAANLSE